MRIGSVMTRIIDGGRRRRKGRSTYVSCSQVLNFRAPGSGIMRRVSLLSIALLACAVAVLIVAEWPRLQARAGSQARARRERDRRKSNLRVLRSESDDFAASVQ